MLAGALLLLGAYKLPLWKFDFGAPQYPEGLSMTIFIDHLGGDVRSINALNHYVGMGQIDATQFSEFQTFPLLIGVLIGFGVLAALVNRGWAIGAWIAGFVAFGAYGLIDFYRWLYAFGHDIDPKAAIQMDPFTPPILGTNTIMNFTITSLPGAAAVLLAVSCALAVLALALLMLAKRREVAPAAGGVPA
jgi:copper chaperone NosL